MADIKSLAVRGIRSFGPEDNDEQRISFEKPLTLILGQNGCGKTTIIECLRYAITGQMPPGSRNECFVHDTKVNRSTEVLGQVKLKLANAVDKQLEISRSMKVTALPKKKSKFQTLDSMLSVIEASGKSQDISSRCVDIDAMVHQELGVSKAILNSVVFCHQEDSNWPLDEGKKVKERFDEIFDADKYSDFFDHIRKIRKEYGVQIKLLVQKVEHLEEKKEELDKKKLDMVNTESRISESEIKVSELSNELTPITKKIKDIEKLQRDLVTNETKKGSIKTKLEHNKTQEQELTKAIKNIFEGTIAELQEKISSYGSTAKNKKKELDDSHKKIFNFNKEEETMADEMSKNEVKFNKLMLLESQNQERTDKKNKMIKDTATLADVEISEVETVEQAEEGMKAILEKLKVLQNDLKEQRANCDAEERKLQAAIDESRDNLTRHQQNITSKDSDIQKLKKEIAKVTKDIADANQSKIKLESMEKKIAEAEENCTKAEAEVNLEELQKEINNNEKAMEELEQESEKISEKISNLQKQSAKLKEKDMLEEQVNSKEKQCSTLKNKHRDGIVEVLGEMPESDFALKVNKVELELRTTVESTKKKLKEKEKQSTRLEAERQHVRDSLNEKRSELTKAENQMYEACGTQTYEATLVKVNASVEKLQNEHHTLQSSIYIMNKYKKQLEENNCCPLCNRGFEAQNEVSELITDLSTKVMNVPATLEKVTEELQKESAKKDELLSLKSLNEKITSLKEETIPNLETKLADVDKKLAELTESIEEFNMTMLEPEKKLQTARQIQREMPSLDRFINEIKVHTKKLEDVKAQCSGFETDITLDEATAKQTELKAKLTELRNQVKTARKQLNDHTKTIQKLVDTKNKLKEQMLNIQKKVQDLVNLEESLKKLEENKEKSLVELKDLQDGVEPLELVLKEKQSAKNEGVMKNRAIIDTKRNYVTKVDLACEKIKSIIKEIKQHDDKKTPQEMEKIKEANKKLMDTKMQIMKDRDTITKKIDSLKDELAKQEIYKRDLEDNLKLRKAQEEIAKCEKQIEEIDQNMSGINVDMIPEKEPLMTRQAQIIRQKAETDGELKILQEKLKQLKVELMKSQNKNVETDYKEKFYDLQITKALDKDLKDYAMALEKCVLEFHKEKMENINLIIREMWRKIYRGNDIDYIEIKTESCMTADSDRRKYDYRVVQSKNGVEIDMRGRCSAGQKVLASLIIRLALAETFSSRFGILALDEPTTNLDQENVQSLCQALGEIVQERMRQKNFMFIIITHDREFIESLGNIDKVSHYYEVSRNNDGKSRIKKIRFT